MMLKYCGVEYDPEVHSPSMDQDDTPHWLTDEAQGELLEISGFFDFRAIFDSEATKLWLPLKTIAVQ